MATKAHTSKGIVLALSCAAQFMVYSIIAIVNVALPPIQQDLGIEQSTLPWIVIAYGLMLGGFLLRRQDGRPLGAQPHATDGTDTVLEPAWFTTSAHFLQRTSRFVDASLTPIPATGTVLGSPNANSDDRGATTITRFRVRLRDTSASIGNEGSSKPTRNSWSGVQSGVGV
jgi:hypothetical protein